MELTFESCVSVAFVDVSPSSHTKRVEGVGLRCQRHSKPAVRFHRGVSVGMWTGVGFWSVAEGKLDILRNNII